MSDKYSSKLCEKLIALCSHRICGFKSDKANVKQIYNAKIGDTVIHTEEVTTHRTYCVASMFKILAELKLCLYCCMAAFSIGGIKAEGDTISGARSGALLWRQKPLVGYDDYHKKWVAYCRFSVICDDGREIEPST